MLNEYWILVQKIKLGEKYHIPIWNPLPLNQEQQESEFKLTNDRLLFSNFRYL